MTDSNANPETHLGNGSRRSFLKNGVLASGALTLGIGVSKTGAAKRSNTLLYEYDYYPGASFTVVTRLQPSTTVNILDSPDDGRPPGLSRLDEYDGYVISYSLCGPPVYSFLFTRRRLKQDRQYTLSQDAQDFSTELDLIQTNVKKGGAAAGGVGHGGAAGRGAGVGDDAGRGGTDSAGG